MSVTKTFKELVFFLHVWPIWASSSSESGGTPRKNCQKRSKTKAFLRSACEESIAIAVQ